MKKKSVNTLADFKATHDPTTRYINKIKEGLKSLAAEGKEAWEHEGDFLRRCGMRAAELCTLRDKFKDHIVNVSSHGGNQVKRAWFGDKRVAAKARG